MNTTRCGDPKEGLQELGSNIRLDGFQQTHQKEKTLFLHFGVLRKRIRLWGERQLASTLDQSAPPLPSSYAIYRGRVKFFKMILTH